jgi:hypothetical protein
MIVSVHRVACESAAAVSMRYCMEYNNRKDGCCSSKALRSYYLWISKSIQSYDATERSVFGKHVKHVSVRCVNYIHATS